MHLAAAIGVTPTCVSDIADTLALRASRGLGV
jgi:hypothetical protein